MKNKLNIVLAAIAMISVVLPIIMFFLSIGKSEVANYNDYVIGGFGGFLIMENLLVPFVVSLIVAIVAVVLLFIRVMRKKSKP